MTPKTAARIIPAIASFVEKENAEQTRHPVISALVRSSGLNLFLISKYLAVWLSILQTSSR